MRSLSWIFTPLLLHNNAIWHHLFASSYPQHFAMFHFKGIIYTTIELNYECGQENLFPTWAGPDHHRPGHSLGEKIKLREMKNEKTPWVFVSQKKYGKFWSVSLEHFIKHKPLNSEECPESSESMQSKLPNIFFWHIWDLKKQFFRLLSTIT